MLVKATAIVKFSGIYKWDIINLNTDTAIINCGAYGKGRIYNLEMSVENESNS